MGTGTIIIVTILFLAIAIPVFNTNRKNKKKEKLLLDRMNEFAEKSNCKISNYQHWKDLQIGIDQDAGKLFFIRNTQAHESASEVDLSQVQHARVLKGERIINTAGDKYVTVDKIDLNFTFRTTRPEMVLNFYDCNYDSPVVQGELQVAEKWKEISNSWISEKNKKS